MIGHLSPHRPVKAVDPRTATIEVHADPCGDRYRNREPYIFGDSVPIGPWAVDTADFRRYGKPQNTRP